MYQLHEDLFQGALSCVQVLVVNAQLLQLAQQPVLQVLLVLLVLQLLQLVPQ